jgi:protocatechuate 4,5-dioxygenase, beta chain
VALDRGLRDTADWKPFFDGYEDGKAWMRETKPDIAVVIFNDHGNSFFLDRVPTFAVGVAESYQPVDEGWGRRQIPPFEGAVDFSWHFVDTLVERHFDPLVCREIDVDHGLQVPMELFFGRPEKWPVKVVPVFVNTIQYPIPTPQRCWEMGIVLREAIQSWPGDERVVIMGTGGLSHQLQGTRAGFINREADLAWLDGIASDPERYRAMSREDYVEQFGSEGAELIMWLVMRAALNHDVKLVHKHYHAPASMTGAGMVVLENAA